MGTISPLNQTSHSFEHVQDLTGFDKSEEYSFFNDHLSPLTYNSNAEHTSQSPHVDRDDQPASPQDQEGMQLFAKVEEPQKKKKPKLFAKEASTSKTGKKGESASVPPKTDVRPAGVKNNAPLHGARQAKQSSVAGKTQANVDVLVDLKQNVKNILQNIKHPSSEGGSQPKTNTSKAQHLPENLSISKLTTEAAKATRHTERQHTTLEHLALRGKQGTLQGQDASKHIREGETQLQKKSLPTAVKQPLKNKQAAQLPGQPLEHSATNKSRKGRKTSAQKTRLQQTGQQNAPHGDLHTTGSSNREQVNATLLTAEGLLDASENKRTIQDAASKDADFNNLLSKGQRKTELIRKQGHKARATTRTARAMNWLRTLADRTSLLDKTNPQWKVLEMNLEKGNGKMTVKVMKESDHVSVAVNFSDPAVKAMAEAEYANILENLQEQYQQEVKFTFNDREQNPFESYTPRHAPSHKSTTHVPSSDLPVHEQDALAEHQYSDHKGWIG